MTIALGRPSSHRPATGLKAADRPQYMTQSRRLSTVMTAKPPTGHSHQISRTSSKMVTRFGRFDNTELISTECLQPKITVSALISRYRSRYRSKYRANFNGKCLHTKITVSALTSRYRSKYQTNFNEKCLHTKNNSFGLDLEIPI